MFHHIYSYTISHLWTDQMWHHVDVFFFCINLWFQDESYYLRSLGEDVRKVWIPLQWNITMEMSELTLWPRRKCLISAPKGTCWPEKTVPRTGEGLPHPTVFWEGSVLLQCLPHQLQRSAAVDALWCEGKIHDHEVSALDRTLIFPLC